MLLWFMSFLANQKDLFDLPNKRFLKITRSCLENIIQTTYQDILYVTAGSVCDASAPYEIDIYCTKFTRRLLVHAHFFQFPCSKIIYFHKVIFSCLETKIACSLDFHIVVEEVSFFLVVHFQLWRIWIVVMIINFPSLSLYYVEELCC